MSEFFKIATWNINSIRLRLNALSSWLQRNNIDILLLQEIKCQNEQFPLSDLEDLGYNVYVVGQKSYNGVAILSKYKADEVLYSFDDNPLPDDARYIEIALSLPIGYTSLASVYVPNGGEVMSDKYSKKLLFLDALKTYFNKSLNKEDFSEKFIIGGDFNVAPEEIDVYSAEEMSGQTCFTDIERAKIRAIKNTGLIDPCEFFEKENIYTWWDYRAGCFERNKGLRIDYFFTSANCASKIYDLEVDKEVRSQEKPSDHAPVILTLSK